MKTNFKKAQSDRKKRNKREKVYETGRRRERERKRQMK